jgi:hypothetical protein
MRQPAEEPRMRKMTLTGISAVCGALHGERGGAWREALHTRHLLLCCAFLDQIFQALVVCSSEETHQAPLLPQTGSEGRSAVCGTPATEWAWAQRTNILIRPFRPLLLHQVLAKLHRGRETNKDMRRRVWRSAALVVAADGSLDAAAGGRTWRAQCCHTRLRAQATLHSPSCWVACQTLDSCRAGITEIS